MHDAVDATQMNRLLQPARFDLLPQVSRDVKTVLNNAAIHIDDIKRAVRSSVEIDGAEAFILRSEKLRFVISVPGLDGAALFRQHVAPDKIAAGFAHEIVAVEFTAVWVAALDQRTARRREVGQREISAQLAVAVTAIDAGIHPNRPGGLI